MWSPVVQLMFMTCRVKAILPSSGSKRGNYCLHLPGRFIGLLFVPDAGEGTPVNLYTASHQISFLTVVAVAVSDPTVISFCVSRHLSRTIRFWYSVWMSSGDGCILENVLLSRSGCSFKDAMSIIQRCQNKLLFIQQLYFTYATIKRCFTFHLHSENLFPRRSL
jgi:hypothetical protein